MAGRLTSWRLATALVLLCLGIRPAGAEGAAWTIVLHPKDYVIGVELGQLKTRHHWIDRFEDDGGFEIAVSRHAVAIGSPQCRMGYLILKIPFYYPENPKQASLSERRAIYDGLVALKQGGGSVSLRVEAPLGGARAGARGMELTSCSLFVTLPLSVQFSR